MLLLIDLLLWWLPRFLHSFYSARFFFVALVALLLSQLFALVASVDFCCCLVHCATLVAVALLRYLHTLVWHNVSHMYMYLTQTHIRQRIVNALCEYVCHGCFGLRYWWEKTLEYSTAYMWYLQDALKPTLS